MLRIDARVPVRFGVAEAPGQAVLLEGVDFTVEEGAHPAACACCAGRASLALALTQLFQKRARGEVPFFLSVRIELRGGSEEALARLVDGDPLVASRFRLDAQASTPATPEGPGAAAAGAGPEER